MTSQLNNDTTPDRRTRGRRFTTGAGFWVAAVAFLVVTAYSTAPTPLWGALQHRDGFSTFAITIAFAAYAVGVVISLFLVGHLGDTVGRRPLVLGGVALQIVSAVVFLVWLGLPGLIVARTISGLGMGMLTATLTAHILVLHLTARPGSSPVRGQIVSGFANLGGLGAGALASGLIAQWAPAPTTTPFAVFLLLMVGALIAVALVPETAARPAVRAPYRPQRIRVPARARHVYLLSAGIAFAAFAVLRLFTSLVPVVVAGELHITSTAVTGSVVFVTFAAGAAAQVLLRQAKPQRKVIVGALLLIAGIALLTGVVAESGGLVLFYFSGIVSGLGAGMLFMAALAIAAGLAAPENRGEVLAGIFLASYVGLSVPVLGVGVATLSVPITTALIGFAVVIIAVVLVSSVLLTGALRRQAI